MTAPLVAVEPTQPDWAREAASSLGMKGVGSEAEHLLGRAEGLGAST